MSAPLGNGEAGEIEEGGQINLEPGGKENS